MRQSLLLLAAAATASAQTRITNWEEQHQRFVRQAAFEELLSWFRQRCVDAGGFVVPGLSQRPGGIRNVFLPSGAKSGERKHHHFASTAWGQDVVNIRLKSTYPKRPSSSAPYP